MTIDWWTLFLQTVNFLLLVWLLQHFLYKPVRAVIEKRRELAEQALRKAEATDKEASKAKTMFESKSAELEKSRKATIEKAQQTAEAEAKKIVAQARKQADGIVADAGKAAEERHAEALATVKHDIVETAVKIAGTILHKTTNTDLNKVFLARVLEEIDSLSKEDRARIASEQGGVEVATSMKLTKEEREAWTKALREKLHLGGETRFTVEPALIGGAELRLTHATVRFAWSDQLDKAADILTKSEAQGVKVD
jgi:F-type H+-transporting ATPase subunit b